MKKITFAGLTLAIVCASVAGFGHGRTESQPVERVADPVMDQQAQVLVDRQAHAIEQFMTERPGAAVFEREGRVRRVYGRSFSRGQTGKDSAENFLAQHAEVLGLTRDQLMEVGPFPDGRHVQPIMYEPETDSFKFTGYYYAQHLDGVPVFRSRMMLLVRNEPGYPLVLASTDVRPLGEFELDAAALQRADERSEAIAATAVQRMLGPAAQREPANVVIWAGVDDEPVDPVLAVGVIAEAGTLADPDTYSKMLYLVDAQTGEILYEENQVLHSTVSGNVSCHATLGAGADICHPVDLTPMPYARITNGSTVVYADEDGNFEIPADSGDQITSRIWGKYFRVFNQADSDSIIIQTASPPNPMGFVHNQLNSSELVRAEVNAYVHSNIVRDFALTYNPNYPVIANQTEFTVNVNLNNNCNAFYNGTSINFYTSGGGCSNTAAATVVYHEYGHHLVNTAGSGQGAYGEGMSDAVAVLITEDPILAYGFQNNCSAGIRSAYNDIQYPCSGGIHFCGQVLSGCVWRTLLELQVTHPDTYLDIIAGLTINSILLHTGTSIDPSITIDFLTLDDDDGDIFNGTPHFQQINAGFSHHNMPAPELDLLLFTYPQGLPESFSSNSPTAFPVGIEPLSGQPAADPEATLHYRVAGDFVWTAVPMQSIGEELHEAVMPAVECGSAVQFYVSALTSTGQTATNPRDGAADPYVRYSGNLSVVFVDEFDDDLGWIVGAPDDDATTGHWERAWPVGTSTGAGQAQPNAPFVGSACYITGQHPGGGAGANDVDHGKTTLFSPVLDLDGATEVVISYMRWYSNHAGANPHNDIFEVDITSDPDALGDGGQSGGDSAWINVETVGPAGPETMGGWYYHEFAVSDFVELTSTVQVRFIASDYDPQALVEAAVDAFYVHMIDCVSPCPADVNGDGVVDVSDLLQLLGAWGPCPPEGACPEDLTGSGVVDVSDLLALLSAWGDCPQ